jgi:hypothetical protein
MPGILANSGWRRAVGRTALHPGFLFVTAFAHEGKSSNVCTLHPKDQMAMHIGNTNLLLSLRMD